MKFSYATECAVCDDAPTNSTCQRCKEAFFDETPGQTRCYCESCEDFIEGQQDRGIK